MRIVYIVFGLSLGLAPSAFGQAACYVGQTQPRSFSSTDPCTPPVTIFPLVTAPKQTTGSSANTNRSGMILLAAAGTTSAAQALTYTNVPSCSVQPSNTAATPVTAGNVAALSGYVMNISATSISVTVGTAAATAIPFYYQCTGNE